MSGGEWSGGGLPRWRKAFFIPTWFKFNGSVCAGAEFVRPLATTSSYSSAVASSSSSSASSTDDDDDAGLFGEGMKLLVALRETNSSAFRFDGSWFGQPGTVLIDRYAGTPRLRELIDAGLSWHEVAGAFSAEARTFEAARKPFLLYD